MSDRLSEIIYKMKLMIMEKNCSIELANWLEVELDELYPNNDEIQEFVTCLALYQPGGGEYLLGINEIIEKCKPILKILESK